MTVRLLLFGSPAIEDGATSFVLPFERRSQLLAFLAVRRGFVGRAELAALLWPDQPAKLAYANLRKTLFRLRAWSLAQGVDVQGGAVRFAVATDLHDFESALRERRMADALAARRGEFLAGFDDADNEAWAVWLGFERERLRALWRGAALDYLDGEIDPGEGIDLSANLLELDPLDESALRAHMSWLARDGQSARAREAYRVFVARLADELGLGPGAELAALHDSLNAGAPRRHVAPLAPARADEGFVGRTVELRRIAALLGQADCRLLTILGPGGVGKTRLAQRAIEELAADHPGGATFVPLEDLASADELGGRIARELGLPLAGKEEPLKQVIAYLAPRRALLVLDNFEQLASESALLERMLTACGQLRIIVTSRVRLALASEWLLPLEGLPCPEAEDDDRIESFDAVRLFVQAARRVGPGLAPAAEAAAIVEICRLVEGLPLALELAAAWTRVLSCDAVAAELRSGTELLHAVDGAQPARHASMDVVFEHSWQRLGAAERDALARLTVFRGGFASDAARTVAGASLPVLGALADKSLLRKEDARVFMHPLVQQLAAMRLGDAARAATERAHALHFHRLLAQLRRTVEDGERDALAAVDAEFENCKLAWRWAQAHAAGDLIAKSATTLLDFCDHRGRYDEGRSLLREGLASPAAGGDPELSARLLAAASHLDYRLDRYAEAEADARRALAASRDHDTRLQSLKVLGGCYLRLGRHEEAKRMFKEAFKQAPAGNDPHNAAAMLDNLALVEKVMGHYDEALRLSIQSLAQHRRLGDAAGEALCLNNLGALHLARNEPAAAGAPLREGLAVCDRHGLVSTRALILANLTEVAASIGDDEAAASYADRALELAEASGNRSVVSWLKLQRVRLALRRGDLVAARADLEGALALAFAVGRPALQLAGVMFFAELLAAQRETECARLVLAFAADHPSMPAAERDQARARLAELPAEAGGAGAWPGFALDELVHRIVVETGIAHAPLIATLRGTPSR